MLTYENGIFVTRGNEPEPSATNRRKSVTIMQPRVSVSPENSPQMQGKINGYFCGFVCRVKPKAFDNRIKHMYHRDSIFYFNKWFGCLEM